MGFFGRDVFSLHLISRLVPFWGWLGKELVKSNFEVARIVLSPRLPISPTMVTLPALPKGRVSQAILGNAITLTPGTVTVDDHEGQLLVHCLTQNGARDLEAGEMNRRAAALER
jgi:multicomponent Na+:H+ antiporter subunit E